MKKSLTIIGEDAKVMKKLFETIFKQGRINFEN